MNFILIVALTFIIIYFFFGGLILNWSTKISGIENFKYKNSLLILLVSGTVSLFIRIFFVLGLEAEILGGILALTVSFFIFHYFIKKYSQTNWKKSLQIYVIFYLIFLTLLFTTALILRSFFFEPFVVRGISMHPNYIKDDYLLIHKLSDSFERNDVIVYKDSKIKTYNLKRIVGLPGEKVEIKEGRLFINDTYLEVNYTTIGETNGKISLILKEDEYFTLGDNRNHSADSRASGPIKKSNIVGKVFYKNSILMDYFFKEDVVAK